MSDTDKSQHSPDTDIGEVLRAAGARAQPAQQLKREVRVTVHEAWRKAVAGRMRRRRIGWAAAASIIGLTALAFWAYRPSRIPPGRDILSGSAYLALAYPGGVSVRLDRHTHIVQVDAQHLILRDGAVYIDAGRTPGAAAHLQIETPAGTVTHLGTQYEIRLLPMETRIRVREGRIALIGPQRAVLEANEQLAVLRDGHVARSYIAADSPQWGWTEQAAPPLDINGRSVHAFLEWIGRELGCQIVYATPEAEAEATRAVLQGSTTGLVPAEALVAVLATTHLRSSQYNERIVIAMQ